MSFILMSLFALSNGYLTSTIMTLGPSKVNIFEKETSGLIMSVSLMLGILSGTILSLLF